MSDTNVGREQDSKLLSACYLAMRDAMQVIDPEEGPGREHSRVLNALADCRVQIENRNALVAGLTSNEFGLPIATLRTPTSDKHAMAGKVGPLTAAALISAELSAPTSDAVNLLREIRAQDFLSDSMRARIDELLAAPAAVAQPKATSDAQGGCYTEIPKGAIVQVPHAPGTVIGWRMEDGVRVYDVQPESVYLDPQRFVKLDDYLALRSALSKPEDGVRVDDSTVERALIALSGHCIDCRPHWHESDRGKMREVLEAALATPQDQGRDECPNCEGEYPDSCWYCDRERNAAPKAQEGGGAVDTGNLARDPLYLALDALYSRGWTDLHKGRDHDPRGTKEWQAALDLFRAYTRPASDVGVDVLLAKYQTRLANWAKQAETKEWHRGHWQQCKDIVADLAALSQQKEGGRG